VKEVDHPTGPTASKCLRWKGSIFTGTGGSDMNRIVVGVDIAKRVFQLHWVQPETGEIVALQLKREKFLEHFANRSKCLIGMEACGGSQH
jgi:hypothetical protein